jgi:hypothetical protein
VLESPLRPETSNISTAVNGSVAVQQRIIPHLELTVAELSLLASFVSSCWKEDAARMESPVLLMTSVVVIEHSVHVFSRALLS